MCGNGGGGGDSVPAYPEAGGEFAVLASIGTVLLIAVMTMTVLKPVLGFLEELRDTAGLTGSTTGPVLKAMAIGILTQTGAGICEDAGEKTIGSALKMAGSTASVFVLLPLMESLLTLVKNML